MFSIRKYNPNDLKDAAALVSIFSESVCVLGPRRYSADQVTAWANNAPDLRQTHQRCTDGRLVLLLVDDKDQAQAFTDLEEDGHIDMLYAAPTVAGSGAVSLLYDELERCARGLGMSRLYTEASETARGFFIRKGYVVMHKRKLNIMNVDIHNYAMEKELS